MFYLSIFTLVVLIPQIMQAYQIKLSNRLENSAVMIRVIARALILIASVVNLHNVLLVFTCIGSLFEAHDCKPYLLTRIGLQMLLVCSIIAMQQTTS
jgi:hypothetical protein